MNRRFTGLTAQIVGVMAFVLVFQLFQWYQGYSNTKAGVEALSQVISVDNKKLAVLNTVMKALVENQRSERTLLIEEYGSNPEEYDYQMSKYVTPNTKLIEDNLAVYEKLVKGDKEHLEFLKNFKEKLAPWQEMNRLILDEVKAKKREHAAILSQNKGRKLFSDLNSILTAEVEDVSKDIEIYNKKVLGDTEKSQQQMFYMLILAVLTSFSLTVGAIFFFIKPLKRLVGQILSIANGDLSCTSDSKRSDEIGDGFNALHGQALFLRKLMSDITTAAKEFAGGYLTHRIPLKDYEGKGVYHELPSWINKALDGGVNQLHAIGAAFIMIREEHPKEVPSALNQGGKMVFLNKFSTDFAGVPFSQVESECCAGFFNTDDCKSNCACKRAFRSGKPEHSRTIARPTVMENGKPVQKTAYIDYYAVPNIVDGKVVTVTEIVFNRTTDELNHQNIMHLAAQLDEVADGVASGSEEMSAQIEQSSRGSDLQKDRVREAATAMEEMSATVLEVAKSASSAAQTAEEVKSRAESGSKVVEEVMQNVGQVKSHAEQLSSDMGELHKRADGIGQIMNVISDIADQTNLLALNAAIEAARAGDAGRGFAVVADEVRKLAEKTMSATKQVADAVGAIQSSALSNKTSTDSTVAEIQKAYDLATQAKAHLEQIVNLAFSSSDQVRAIATASEQQSGATEEINSTVSEIDKISSEIADAMGQSHIAVKELAERSATLRQMVQELRNNEKNVS